MRRPPASDHAVSAVIAVLLMVAVTVTMAAAAYVWTSSFRQDERDMVRAAFGARAVDLPEGWNDADAPREVDADNRPDAIEVVLANSPRDIAASDITLSLDGSLLTWNAASGMYFVGGDSDAGEACGTSPGRDGDDDWEPGAVVVLVRAGAGVQPSDLCDGGASLTSDLGSLEGRRSFKVSAKGQVVLDTSIEVHDDAGA